MNHFNHRPLASTYDYFNTHTTRDPRESDETITKVVTSGDRRGDNPVSLADQGLKTTGHRSSNSLLSRAQLMRKAHK